MVGSNYFAKLAAVMAALLLQTWQDLSLIQSVGIAVIVCALANVFYEHVGWLVIPHGPNPFAFDTREARQGLFLNNGNVQLTYIHGNPKRQLPMPDMSETCDFDSKP